MIELLTGLVVAVVAVAVVLEPMVRPQWRWMPHHEDEDLDADILDLDEAVSPKVKALLALREIEFDRATGKLSDDDYASLKRQYSAAALTAIDEEAQSTSVATEDETEALIRQARERGRHACPDCGDRPEANAVFCSRCGRSLLNPEARPRCWMCGGELDAGARFCGNCGIKVTA